MNVRHLACVPKRFRLPVGLRSGKSRDLGSTVLSHSLHHSRRREWVACIPGKQSSVVMKSNQGLGSCPVEASQACRLGVDPSFPSDQKPPVKTIESTTGSDLHRQRALHVGDGRIL